MSTEKIASSRARVERLIRMRNAIVIWLQKLTRQYNDEREHSIYQQAWPETIAQADEILASLRECDSILDSAIIEYSQACARPLGERIQDIPQPTPSGRIPFFPTETGHRHARRLELKQSKWVFPWLEAPPYDSPTQDNPLHYEDPKYFGATFVLELTELYFRRTTFVCDQFMSPSWVPVAFFPPLGLFLKHDPFKTGFNVHLRIQKLELNLLERAWVQPDALDRRFLVEDKNTSVAERLSEMELEANIISERLSDLSNSLSIIRKKCDINIKFSIWLHHDEGLMGWRVMCTALMPMVKMLEKNGCTVSFQANMWRVGFYSVGVEVPWCDKFWDMKTTSQPFYAYLVDMLKKFPVSDVASEKSTVQAFSQQFTDRPFCHRP